MEPPLPHAATDGTSSRRTAPAAAGAAQAHGGACPGHGRAKRGLPGQRVAAARDGRKGRGLIPRCRGSLRLGGRPSGRSGPAGRCARPGAVHADAGARALDHDRREIDPRVRPAAVAAGQAGQGGGAAHAAALSLMVLAGFVASSRSAAFCASVAALKMARLSSCKARSQLPT